jgi:orotidine-5'-phosphate decarboxylase
VTSFGERVSAALAAHGPLCVGIDPHTSLLEEWGMDASAAGAREFGLRVVEAAAGRVGIVKPQVAFFERYGSAGFAALEEVLASARETDLIVIADAKRGDIGTTMDGYAAAWLEPGSPLEADAVTLSPYLGPDSLRTTLTTAIRHGKGAFVLAATSNPEAFALQSAQVVDVAATDGQTVAERVARDIAWVNGSAAFPGSLGPVGLVVGATVDRCDRTDRRRPPGRPDPRTGIRGAGRRAGRSRRALRPGGAERHRQREPQHPVGRTRRDRAAHRGSRGTVRRFPWLNRARLPRSTGSRHPVAPSPPAASARRSRRTCPCASSRRRSCFGAPSPSPSRPPAPCA